MTKAVLWLFVEGERLSKENRFVIANPELAHTLTRDTIFNVSGLGYLRIGTTSNYNGTLLISARELLPWESI